MMTDETKPVFFRDIFGFLFLFLLFGVLISLFLGENLGDFVKWVILNSILAVLATLVIMIIWAFQKNNSKRYYSLLSFVMLWVLTFYTMSPIFKILFPSKYFWILLSVTLGYMIFLLLNRIKISKGILNPREIWFKKLLLIYLVVFSCFVIGLFVYVNILNLYSGEMIAVAIFLYFVGFLFLSLSPVFLTTPEMAKKLKEISLD